MKSVGELHNRIKQLGCAPAASCHRPAFHFSTKGLSACIQLACLLLTTIQRHCFHRFLFPYFFKLKIFDQFSIRVLLSNKDQGSNKRAITMIPDANINPSHRSSTSFANPNSKLKFKSDRRRCLKTLFHIPLGARSKSCGYDDIDIDGTSMKANTSTLLAGSVLPQDIIREIVDLLSPADILSFSLTVRVFWGGFVFISSSRFSYSHSVPPHAVILLPYPPPSSLIRHNHPQIK